MTTSRKLWLGFGTLTALLVLFSASVTLRLQSVRNNVQEQADVARPRSVTARELKISVIEYALAIRTFLSHQNSDALDAAANSAADAERHLANYRRLAATDSQRALADRFAALWQEYQRFAQSLVDAKDSVLQSDDSERLANLGATLDAFLDDEVQADAVASFNGRRDATFRGISRVTRLVLLFMAVGAALAAVVGGIVGRGILTSERSLKESRDFLRTTLGSIGDAVITTDARGLVTYLNPVAGKLTQWDADEACGQSLPTVFNIVKEGTREPVENRVPQVLTSGQVVGLAHHTVLLGKNGAETPIDDSAAPIRDDHGDVAGVVLVFRDITERRQGERAKAEASQLAALRADISGALALSQDLPSALQQCAEAFVTHLDMAFARIWTLQSGGTVLELRASAGLYTHLDGPHAQVTVGKFKIGRIAQTRQPLLTNDVAHDSNISDPAWADREGMVAFAGHPLLVGEQLVGVMAMFARHSLTKTVLDDLRPIAAGLAQFIHRKRAEEAVRRVEARRTAMLESALDAIITMDSEGRIVEFNRAAETIFGLTQQQALGQPMDLTIIPPKYRERHRRGLAHYLETGEGPALGQRLEMPAQRIDGTEFPAELAITAIPSDGAPMFTAFIRDITERTKMQDELKQTAEDLRRFASELSESDRRKNEFLAMLAHELRNPLAPIRNALHIMELAGDNPEQVRPASEMMQRQVAHMVRLVDDLLDVSRISRGKIALRLEQVDLAVVMNHALETAMSLPQCAGRNLTVTLPPQPVHLTADPIRLAQVISNLVNNACKFTDAVDRIWVTADCDGDHVIIRVGDTGVGIAADQLPRIFEMFAQVDASLERSTGGLGIGLTLVKTLVELHGGTVTASSRGAGQGTEFIVSLPMTVDRSAAPLPEPAAEAAVSTTPRRILVVDDHHDGAEFMSKLLQMNGHQIYTAYDGEAAVQAAATHRPDVVLLDIGLPKLNGYDAARRIRQQSWSQGMVLVALTGWAQDDDRRKSVEAGFDYHLVKPVTYEALVNLLAKLPKQTDN